MTKFRFCSYIILSLMVLSCADPITYGDPEEERECTSLEADYCTGEKSYKTCKNGKWVSKDCQGYTHCENGSCILSPQNNVSPNDCSNGEKECTGSIYRQCINGKWHELPCNGACVDGVCQQVGQEVCDSSAKPVCEGNSVVACVGGIIDKIDCGIEQNCKDGECVPNNPAIIVEPECTSQFIPKCDGNAVLSCQNEHFKTTRCEEGRTCRETESGAICEQNTVNAECKASESPVCVGNKIKSCFKGKYAYTDCKQLQCEMTTTGAACVQVFECDEKTPRTCDGGRIKSCQAGFFSYEPCPSGTSCQDSAYGAACSKTSQCNANFKPTCEGNSVKSCKNGAFNYEDCANLQCTLTNGSASCAAPSIPALNAPCQKSSFVELCHDNAAYTCQSGKVAIQECVGLESCFIRADDYTAACATSCSPNDPPKFECLLGDAELEDLAISYQCAKTADGRYAHFLSDVEYCSDICSPAVGCTESGSQGTPQEGDRCDVNSFKEFCSNNIGYYCYDGRVEAIECDEETPCGVRASDVYVACMLPCAQNDPELWTCDNYSYESSVQIFYGCSKTTQGDYGYFYSGNNACNYYQICDNELGCIYGY